MIRGLVVGKFYPPHKGHAFLIDSARAQVDHLDVFVIYTADQWIPGSLRAQWVRERHPDCQIHEVLDHGDDDNSQLWAELTRNRLGYAPDVVFSSESYGDSYAYYLGCRHVCVDPKRQNLSISATQIRNDPWAHSHFMEPAVRAFFVRRIVLIGAESTGKTTLAQQLAQHYQTLWVPEYGRTLWEERLSRGLVSFENPNWVSDDFLHIVNQQIQSENGLARQASRLLICDTDPLATCVWHERFLGFSRPDLYAKARNLPHDLYLLCTSDTPFVQDGTRDGEHIRHAMHQRFEQVLQAVNAPYSALIGSWQDRFTQATQAIDACLAKPWPAPNHTLSPHYPNLSKNIFI
ncbi:MAG: AAA family ATPase [Acidobacteria bacterium]|nr:AAA family ATPase [Acidobacteriota bacterium]MCB9399396.1 AAA family ATPase [Acidobacteriota bacterium]